MLYIDRKQGQTVVIADNIVITVKKTRSGQVSLAFDAPLDVPIYRGEVYARMQEERKDRGTD